MERKLNQRTAGWACIGSGVLLTTAGVVFDHAYFGEPNANATMVRIPQTLFAASVPGLVGGVRAFVATLPSPAPRPSAIGQAMVYAIFAATGVGSLLSVARPKQPPWLNPLGSVLQSVGMLVLGSVTLRSNVFADWSRWVPLLIGAWFFAYMPAQFAFFAGPNGIPSHTLMRGVWGPLWALLGVMLITRTRTVAAAAQ
jgi:hypothetical protein